MTTFSCCTLYTHQFTLTLTSARSLSPAFDRGRDKKSFCVLIMRWEWRHKCTGPSALLLWIKYITSAFYKKLCYRVLGTVLLYSFSYRDEKRARSAEIFFMTLTTYTSNDLTEKKSFILYYTVICNSADMGSESLKNCWTCIQFLEKFHRVFWLTTEFIYRYLRCYENNTLRKIKLSNISKWWDFICYTFHYLRLKFLTNMPRSRSIIYVKKKKQIACTIVLDSVFS